MRLETKRLAETKTILRNGGLFLLIFAFFDLLLPYLFLLTITQLQIKSSYAFAPTDILVLGDSHTAAALDPAIFAQQQLVALNYSRGGHYAEFNEAFYAEYRRRFAPPKVVILSAPYFMFANGSDATAMISLLDGPALTQYYLANQGLSTPNFYRYGALFQELPLYLKRFLAGEQNALLKYGYMATLDPTFRTKDLTAMSDDDALASRPLDYTTNGYTKNQVRNQQNRQALQRLLQQLAQDQVAVFLLETPEYRGTQAYIGGKATFYQEVEEEIAPYPNVRFIPQTAIPAINPADRRLFSDGGYGNGNSHLSYSGSQIYTNAVIELIRAEIGGNQ